MTKKLEFSETIVKVVLSLMVIFSYFTNLIQGYFALATLILALLTLVIYIARLIITMFLID
jgi:hypothetical protein